MKHRHMQKSIVEIHGLERITELIFETRGKLSQVAKRLGCSSGPLYSLVRESPEVEKLLEEARRIAREDRIDDCETYAETIAERYEEDTTNALKAAIYFLNTHGKDRGYGKDIVNVNEELERLRQLLAEKIGDPPKPVNE